MKNLYLTAISLFLLGSNIFAQTIRIDTNSFSIDSMFFNCVRVDNYDSCYNINRFTNIFGSSYKVKNSKLSSEQKVYLYRDKNINLIVDYSYGEKSKRKLLQIELLFNREADSYYRLDIGLVNISNSLTFDDIVNDTYLKEYITETGLQNKYVQEKDYVRLKYGDYYIYLSFYNDEKIKTALISI